MTKEEIEKELKGLHYYPVYKHNYAEWFRTVQYNGKTLTPEERKDFIKVTDEVIAVNCEGQHLTINGLELIKGKEDDLSRIERAIYSVWLFLTVSMADCMVAAKYYLLADNDYDKRYMRGKMQVLYNEGFKQLYGYEENTKSKSKWYSLLPYMKFFPEEINRQYQDMSALLERHSKQSTWWKDERNCETHLDAEKLYLLRQEKLEESKVMMDSLLLFNALMAVQDFLTNAFNCVYNHMVGKVLNGEVVIDDNIT